MKVKKVYAREVLDSRGNPTVEAEVTLESGAFGRAIVPSGASTGTHEALELRDGDNSRFLGKGVLTAVKNVNETISQALVGKDFDQVSLDKYLLELDGTDNKQNLGANAILAVSLAFAWAKSDEMGKMLYQYIGDLFGNSEFLLPRPMFNIMNGGRHANWATDIQEFMVIIKHESYKEQVRMACEIFQHLGKILDEKGFNTNVGNEGGYAPNVKTNAEALELILSATEKAGFRPGEDVVLGIDFAASEFHIENKPGEQDDSYNLKKDHQNLNVDEWIAKLAEWLNKYPIVSAEDPLAQDSWRGWAKFLESTENKLEQVVGDDLLVTNVDRIERAIQEKSCNALLVKINQIGTLSETLDAMRLSRSKGWKNIVSHRSGETEDITISHIAVGTGCGQIKTGAPSRGERTAKFNELLRIADSL